MLNNVGLFLAKRAHLSPALEAFVDPATDRRLTFAELDARSNRTANALAGAGVGHGDRVALLMMNGAEFIESFFAIAKLGAVVVPLNWRLVADELAFILSDSGAKTLLFDREFADTVAALNGRAEPTGVETWVQVGHGAVPDFARDYDELQSAAAAESPAVSACDDDLLYIMYTSGTTGLPKGVMHTHATAMWGVVTSNATSDMHYGDRYIVALPLFHVGALTPLTTNVYAGVTSVVLRSFDPVVVWQTVANEKITSMLAVPAMLNFMLQVRDKVDLDRSTLRWIMSGAAPVPVSLIEAYHELGIEIHQVYGLTETCGPACLISTEDAVRKAGSTGKPFFHTDVRVVGEDGNEVARGEVGEVAIRGAHVMKGYWNRPDATAETLRDGWLYSGDLASMDDDGFVTIRDRSKDMIISGGENIYPAEIENALLENDDVRDAAVIGQPSEKWGETPVAVIVPASDGVTAQSVLDDVAPRLARFKHPKAVEFVDEIPRNPSGKILKRLLRERFPGPAAE